MEKIETRISNENKQAYEKMCEGTPDAIYILSKGAVKSGKIMRLKSNSYADLDPHGSMGGGAARMLSGVELHTYFPSAEIVATSHIKADLNYAQIMAEELRRKGVTEEEILIQESSYSTYTELVEMMKMALERDWKHIVILVNEFQIERAKAIIEHAGDLHDPNGYWKSEGVQEAIAAFKTAHDIHFTFVSAEEVLSHKGPRYKRIVDEAKKLPAWDFTMKRENEGARQIRAGEYWKGKEPATTIRQ